MTANSETGMLNDEMAAANDFEVCTLLSNSLIERKALYLLTLLYLYVAADSTSRILGYEYLSKVLYFTF